MRLSRTRLSRAAAVAAIIVAAGALAPLASCAAAAAAPVAPAGYRAVDLGTFGGDYSYARVLNDVGHVAGEIGTAGGPFEGFLWRDGVATDLGAMEPLDINNRDQVVGTSSVINGMTSRAMLWQDGTLTDLGTLGGGVAVAVAINDAGQIIGISATATGAWDAFLWEHGHMRDLGNFQVAGINNRGQITGVAPFGPNGDYHAFLWQDGQMTDLGVLTGSYSEGIAINEPGQIIGDGTLNQAFVWHGTMTDLGSLGSDATWPSAINDRGQIIGYSAARWWMDLRPFLWEHGTMTDLTRLGIPADAWITDINNAGVIAGSYPSFPETPHATLWIPTA